MLLIDYPSIRGEDLSDYSKATWNLLNANIDAHSQILINEYPGCGVKSISIMQYKCLSTIFDGIRRYNILFQKEIKRWRVRNKLYQKVSES